MRNFFESMWSGINTYVQLLPENHKLLPKLLAVRFAVEELLKEAPSPENENEERKIE